jgi:hypothetical protein
VETISNRDLPHTEIQIYTTGPAPAGGRLWTQESLHPERGEVSPNAKIVVQRARSCLPQRSGLQVQLKLASRENGEL